jgi:acyl-CoA hydrolase
LLTLKASVNYVGNSSMVVGIRVVSENIKTGVIRHCNSSYLTMVAKDEEGNNEKVPTLLLANLEDVRRFYDCVIRINQKKQNKILEDKFDHTSEKSLEKLSDFNVKLLIN